jgi:Mg2+-importing ATPase
MAAGRYRSVIQTVNRPELNQFWSLPSDKLLEFLGSSPRGLSAPEAERRFRSLGPASLGEPPPATTTRLLARQFGSPLVILLILAAGLSMLVRQAADATVILIIVLASGFLGFWQERRAATAVQALLALVRSNATVIREGVERLVPHENVVPGDVIILAAGSLLPADCALLGARDLFVDESALTGESFPVQKRVGISPADAPIAGRTGALFFGTHVVTGAATAVVVLRGDDTEFGQLSRRLRAPSPETEFERGIRRFGYMLLQVTLVLAILVLAINVALRRPVLDSMLFTLALAVGLAPELLPAIVTVTLAHGARAMARSRVIVRKLASIEDLGSMKVLCLDKTGTITEGVVKVHSAVDAGGTESEKVLLFAYLNASLQTGFANPIDETLRSGRTFDISGYRKIDEVPYDFSRKRLSVVVEHEDQRVLITKGAVENVLQICRSVERADGTLSALEAARADINALFAATSTQGLRSLGVAYRVLPAPASATRADEEEMIFLGLLALADAPKPGVAEQLAELSRLGVTLKLVTGDSRLVATSIARQVGLPADAVISGEELGHLSDPALRARASATEIFAEVDPNQKDRIIRALRADGTVVGFLGDGINDAVALHTADVGISVNSAVDVTKQAADIVLLEKDLAVLAAGLREGRRAFANTLKYIYITTSANFGNMLSMAVASIFIAFLPLLPKQILLINFLTDLPSVALANDRLDPEMVERPRRWNTRLIRDFMIVFGLVSSVFDLLTFAVLLLLLRSNVEQFRTGWFLESVISEILVLVVIRTARPFYRSSMGRPLLMASALVAAAVMLMPYTRLGRTFGFAPVSPLALAYLGGITVAYLLAAEMAKRFFFSGSRHQ